MPGNSVFGGSADTLRVIVSPRAADLPFRSKSSASPAGELAAERSPLRLTVTRGALGLEVYEPIEFGPFVVEGLTLSIPGLSFPVDVSGGVPVFRHRRGEFECAEMSLPFGHLERWLKGAERRLRRILGVDASVRSSVWSVDGGLGIGLSAHGGALAFEVLWAPVEGHARWVVVEERGVGFETPALALALRVMDLLCGAFAERAGRSYQLSGLAAELSRRILPGLGVRVPASDGVRLGALESSAQGLRVRLDRRLPVVASGASAVQAVELASLASGADDCLAAGEIDAARKLYLNAFEQAPRHPVLARHVAEIDAWVEGRQEAALGILVECGPAIQAGAVGVELLAHSGDTHGALAAAEALANAEAYAPLAALYWLRLAELNLSFSERMRALDLAVARAPALARVRWARFEAYLYRGDIRGALADAEHLEAAEEGSKAKHFACLRAGKQLLEAGFLKESSRTFERALRYCPDDPEATWGLAKAFAEAGRGSRAVALFGRAIQLSEAQEQIHAGALLDLARVLAELGDLPAAIARLRQVPARVPEELDARGLEARYRVKIGDLVGASQSFARLRDILALGGPENAQKAASWLVEAALFEQERRGDAFAAERHLAQALRLDPRDPEVARLYRDVAAQIAGIEASRAQRAAPPEAGRMISLGELPDAGGASVPALEPLSVEPILAISQPGELELPAPGVELAAEPPDSEAEAYARVERLRSRLEAEPEDDAIAQELALVLERLGRDLELFALLSARIEDAGPAEEERLRPLLVGVLGRLRDEALGRGATSEAELYAFQLLRYASA